MSEKKSFPDPKLKMGNIPIWFHNHGSKMDVPYYNEDLVVIESNAGRVTIQRRETHREILWKVNYHIIHGENMLTYGDIIMTSTTLARAFALDDGCDEFGSQIVKEYGGTTGLQGKYIRYKNYLNLPGPGTGHDGDPNLSIELSEKIISTIKQLLVWS